RVYPWAWGHLLHDRTADRLAAMVGRLPHATATVLPFQLGKVKLVREDVPNGAKERSPREPKRRRSGQERAEAGAPAEETVPIGEVVWRQKARIAGRVTSVEVQPWRGAQVLSCTVTDQTGSIALVFTRRDVPGVETGAQLLAEGTIGQHDGRLVMLNPLHQVLRRALRDPVRG
ncbi:MAG TPA: OB-fold nucleic acid binding domain-containing protein, partial [Acidimicrobiales bacterium]|nr:OB-fold nucleic acid binding domain-containing protein [Acidimicrobiales bacterium]